MIDEVKEDGGLPSACPCADLALLVDKTAVQAMPPPEGSERSFLLGCGRWPVSPSAEVSEHYR